MRRHILFALAIVFFPATLFAQTIAWESVPVPNYVGYVNGVSVGWHQATQYTYMIGSNLAEPPDGDTLIYCTDVAGAQSWPSERQVRVYNANHISACRGDGRNAASTVNLGNYQAGVHFTNDGGQTWGWNAYLQPQHTTAIRCVAYYPLSGNGNVVIGNAHGYQPTMWRQTNRQEQWESCDPDPPDISEWLGWTNSLRYFMIGEGQTELYACKDETSIGIHSKLWRSVDDGLNWDEIGGWIGFRVWDIARTPGQDHPHYFVLWQEGNIFFEGPKHLYHSTNLSDWAEVTGFIPPADGLNIIVTSMNDDSNIPDTLWYVSSNHLTMFVIDEAGSGTQLAQISAGVNYFNPNAIDYSPLTSPENPFPTLYVGREWSFEQFRYNSSNNSYDDLFLLDGTNRANIVNISMGVGDVAIGGGLYALGERGGLVFISKKLVDPNSPNDWEVKSTLLLNLLNTLPNEWQYVITATGTDITTYYEGGPYQIHCCRQ